MVKLWASLLVCLVAGKDLFYCPDNYSACEMSNTCCARASGDYACCPMQNAICCGDSDGHCCPAGYPICDIPHKRCLNHLGAAAPTEHAPIVQSLETVQSYPQILVGFADGAGISTNVRQAGACAYYSYYAATKLMEALRYLGATSSEFNLFYAIEMLGDGIQEISEAVYSCTMAATLNLDTLKRMYMELLADPETLLIRAMGNVWMRGNLIQREWQAFLSNTDDYKRGVHFGRATHELFRERKH